VFFVDIFPNTNTGCLYNFLLSLSHSRQKWWWIVVCGRIHIRLYSVAAPAQ